MSISNAGINFIPDKLEWDLIAEFSSRKILSDPSRSDELTDELLLKTIRGLSLPAVCVENVALTLKKFAREAVVHHKVRLELPGYIRIFCKKLPINDAKSAETSNFYNVGRILEQVDSINHSHTEIYGGWGYFFIERTGDFSAETSEEVHYFVDLYLYREG